MYSTSVEVTINVSPCFFGVPDSGGPCPSPHVADVDVIPMSVQHGGGEAGFAKGEALTRVR